MPAAFIAGMPVPMLVQACLNRPLPVNVCAPPSLQVAGIAQLSSLMFLDVSFNFIQNLDVSQLPSSLRFLQVGVLVADFSSQGCMHTS